MKPSPSSATDRRLPKARKLIERRIQTYQAEIERNVAQKSYMPLSRLVGIVSGLEEALGCIEYVKREQRFKKAKRK